MREKIHDLIIFIIKEKKKKSGIRKFQWKHFLIEWNLHKLILCFLYDSNKIRNLCTFILILLSSMLYHLLVRPYSIKALIHYGNPTIFWGQNKERHQSLAQIVKVVFVIDPSIAFLAQFQTLSFVFDHVWIRTLAVEKNSLEELKNTVKNRVKIGTITTCI